MTSFGCSWAPCANRFAISIEIDHTIRQGVHRFWVANRRICVGPVTPGRLLAWWGVGMLPQPMEKHMFRIPKACLLSSLLLTACGDGHGDDNQGGGSCYTQSNSDSHATCVSYYGDLDMPSQSESYCDLWGGEWSNEDCPDGFYGMCDTEITPDSGSETYYYGSVDGYAEGTCEAAGGGVWYD